jgi:hypothetical protein
VWSIFGEIECGGGKLKRVFASGELFLVDGDGQVLEEAGTGDVLTIRTEEDVVRYHEQRPVNEGRNYVKVYTSSAVRMGRILTATEMQVAFRLIPYIWANTGILKKRNGQFLTRKYFLDDNPDLAWQTVDKAFAALINKGVLAKAVTKGKKAYIANPYIFQIGTRSEKTLLDLFSHTKWTEGGGELGGSDRQHC